MAVWIRKINLRACDTKGDIRKTKVFFKKEARLEQGTKYSRMVKLSKGKHSSLTSEAQVSLPVSEL